MAFITSLRIKNFFSIKDEVTIDFKASQYNIENNLERLFEFNGEYYNKIISFYGANASGKTTVLKAITLLANVISNENSEQPLISFKNKFAPIDRATVLSISFVIKIENILKEFFYEVEFSSIKYKNNGIKDELLFESINNSLIVFLKRKEKNIPYIDENIINGVYTNLSNNKSLIEEFYKFEKRGILKEIYTFFSLLSHVSNITLYQTELNTTYRNKETIARLLDDSIYAKELELFFTTFLNSINIDITKINVKFKEGDIKQKEFLGLEVLHSINSKEFIEFDLESDGTQNLIKILMDIFSAKVMGTPLIIDELDSILHPALVPIIINLLIENNIQIIYSTHNIYNMTFLQNDEVFLIEKDSNHITTIKPVKDNPNIKGYENILIHYENGDLGGIPNVKEIITKII